MFSWRMMKLLKSWSGRESSRRNSQSVTNAEIYCDSVACFTTAALEASWDGEVALGCLSAFQCWLPSFLASSFNSTLVLFWKGAEEPGEERGSWVGPGLCRKMTVICISHVRNPAWWGSEQCNHCCHGGGWGKVSCTGEQKETNTIFRWRSWYLMLNHVCIKYGLFCNNDNLNSM